MRRARAGLLACVLLLGGCERAMHDMYQQPRDTTHAPTDLFADGSSARAPVPGSVAMAAGAAADASSGRRGGLHAVPDAGPALPLDDHGRDMARGSLVARSHSDTAAVTMAQLQRGRERFDIDCAPCHGRTGDGQGMVARRGFPAPPSFHDDKLRQAPDSHFYQVITHGYGVMYPYADRVDPADRWAIVAYVRALQLSRHALPGQLDAQDLRQLGMAPTKGAPR